MTDVDVNAQIVALTKRAEQAETIAGNAKWQNERLVDRVVHLEARVSEQAQQIADLRRAADASLQHELELSRQLVDADRRKDRNGSWR